MKVIVFGGTGWVGHSIANAFASAGDDVTVCSRGRKSDYIDGISEGVRRVQADKSDGEDVRRVLADGFDVVVDSVPSEKTIDHVAAHAGGIARYIHCSSTGAYAPLPAVPGDETMPYTDYRGGWRQKAVVDGKALRLHASDGFPAAVIRPTYITGPGMRPLDNLGGRREDFIPDILAGKVIDLPGDGRALLQPVHVKGLAEAFVLAAKADRAVGEVYNVTSAKAVTLTRYVELNAEALGREARVNLVPLDEMLARYPDADEIGMRFLAEHMCYDISKARAQLGWEPGGTAEEAIIETARWAAGVH